MNKKVAIIGTGPAALMAAHVLASNKIEVHLFEKRNSAARKLLIAGSSGLNITNALPLPEFVAQYPEHQPWFKHLLQEFSPKDWTHFIEKLGISTFKGTSGRYFVESMTAGKLLTAWRKNLSAMHVTFHFNKEAVDFSQQVHQLRTHFSDGTHFMADAVLFALGGGSYEPEESPLRWPKFFIKKKIKFLPFAPSNVGHRVQWSKAFLKEAEGLPLKNISLISSKGSRKGDLVITREGIEGTPVYSLGQVGIVNLDLKPDLSASHVLQKLSSGKENLSPIRRIKKHLKLCPAAEALLFHHSPDNTLNDLVATAKVIKHFPLQVVGTQALDEAISSHGGIALSELDINCMLKKHPGIFMAGEMLAWDAPTGGFLIQACVSQGFVAAKGILQFLSA